MANIPIWPGSSSFGDTANPTPFAFYDSDSDFIIDADTTVDGFIAHEVSSIVPEAITGTKDATQEIKNVILNADGSFLTDNINQKKWEEGKIDKIYADNTTWVASKTVPDYQSIDQSKIVPLLTKTILELEARITALESA